MGLVGRRIVLSHRYGQTGARDRAAPVLEPNRVLEIAGFGTAMRGQIHADLGADSRR